MNGPGTITDGEESISELVRRSQKGDRMAFDRIINIHAGRIHRMVYFRVRSAMDAEDITQEVFITAWQKISSLKEPEKFQSWLYRIAVNRSLDHSRKRKFFDLFRFGPKNAGMNENEEELEVPDTVTPSPLDRVMEGEFKSLLEGFSASLSKMEREVFTLRFMDQLGLREIAETLQKDESTVKTHLYRALAKFRANDGLSSFLTEAAP
ncbi:MAG: RNA polymerase sigma factor [Deltaproteobacteria bacterium]|nr:RNA polymerase sigma factor [Deltaproteobacteria bacterium]